MKRLMVAMVLVGCLAARGWGAPREGFGEAVQPVVEKYCVKCHGNEKAKNGVNLQRFLGNGRSVLGDLRLWTDVVRVMKAGEMPPEDKAQPEKGERERVVKWVEGMLEAVDRIEDPGWTPIRRLTRAEYNNTVRDLLGVTVKPADKFPSDGGGGEGFDNSASVLFIPPLLMERYLLAADEVIAAADAGRLMPVKAERGKERDAARENIRRLMRGAYRRPVEDAEVGRVMKVVDAAVARGETLEAGTKLGMKAVLASPRFLFRVEREQAGAGTAKVDDYELASRLSYFLWSSMPDEELMGLAEHGKLHEAEVLAGQVKRMLADGKSRALAEQFAGQWLGVRDLARTAQTDRGRFPEFTASLRDAMVEETVVFFEHLLREDRPVLELLDCNYAYVNEELAKHYGIEGVKGAELRRVELKDANRGGVLGMAAVLTKTSYALRTSPVLRGKWVLEEILGTPPPPPPVMVKTLPTDDKARDGMTFRQRLEQHRKDSACASCHARMDPLGFGLEGFDPIGRWRTKIGGEPVDATGKLASGETFSGPAELKRILMGKKEQFVRNLSEKMLGYALGRGLEYYDSPAVKRITAATASGGYRSSVLVTQIVASLPFGHRRGADYAEPKP